MRLQLPAGYRHVVPLAKDKLHAHVIEVNAAEVETVTNERGNEVWAPSYRTTLCGKAVLCDGDGTGKGIEGEGGWGTLPHEEAGYEAYWPKTCKTCAKIGGFAEEPA